MTPRWAPCVLAVAAIVELLLAHRVGAQIIAPSGERNVVYVELGGPGGIFSLNYERLNASDVYLRIGAGTWGFTNLDNVREELRTGVVGAPRRFDVSDLLGRGEGRFVEVGGAVAVGHYFRSRYGATEVDGAFVSAVPEIGIRYEPPGGGFTYRITFAPMLPLINSASAFPRASPELWGGFSAGYSFR